MSARILCLAPILLAACQGLGSAPAEPEELDPEQQFALYKETAFYHYDNDDMYRAEAQALKALEIHPEDSGLMLVVGWASMRRGTPQDWILAHGIFSDLEGSDDFRAWIGLATAKSRLGQGYHEAADDFATGERIPEGEDVDVPALIDELQQTAQEHWLQSEALYQRVLDERPDERLAINGMQRLALHRGDHASALSWADRLLEQTAAELEFFRNQLRREDLTADAEDRLRRNERELQGIAVTTALTAARALRQLDRIEEAIAYLDRVLVSDPDQPEGLALRGQFRTDLGLWVLALDDLDAFLRASDLPYEHPQVQRAYELRETCERGLRTARTP